MLTRIQTWFENIFDTANGPSRRSILNNNLESHIKDLFVVGDLAGAPVIKLAMEQGYQVAKHISSLKKIRNRSRVFTTSLLSVRAQRF